MRVINCQFTISDHRSSECRINTQREKNDQPGIMLMKSVVGNWPALLCSAGVVTNGFSPVSITYFLQ